MYSINKNKNLKTNKQPWNNNLATFTVNINNYTINCNIVHKHKTYQTNVT